MPRRLVISNCHPNLSGARDNMKNKAICLSLLMLFSASLQAADDLDSITQKFIGDYELVSYFTFPAQGDAVDMSYIGRLSYDALGNMAGLGMPKNLPERAAGSSERVTGGFAYWGPFSIDVENSIVIHHVKGSPMVPRWVGGDNIRYYEFSDGLLRLSLKNPDGRVTATLSWRKLQ